MGNKLDRFLCKPVEIEVGGETLSIMPFTTQYYPLLNRSQRISLKLLKKIKKGQEITEKEYSEKDSLDLEISYLAMKDIFPELTKEIFDKQLDAKMIDPIMEAVFKVNGLTDEDMKKVKKMIENLSKSNKGVKKSDK